MPNPISEQDRTILQEHAGSLLLKGRFAIRRANPGMSVFEAEELAVKLAQKILKEVE